VALQLSRELCYRPVDLDRRRLRHALKKEINHARNRALCDLHISPFREDGVTYATPTWIWSVVVDGNLYVPAYNGTNSSWYQAATKQKAARIAAGGLTKEVAFEAVEGQIDDRIDDAYRAKYQSSLKAMISSRTRSATVRIVPRD
jgi:hypothetical protein